MSSFTRPFTKGEINVKKKRNHPWPEERRKKHREFVKQWRQKYQARGLVYTKRGDKWAWRAKKKGAE
jgi:hypothetical protein